MKIDSTLTSSHHCLKTFLKIICTFCTCHANLFDFLPSKFSSNVINNMYTLPSTFLVLQLVTIGDSSQYLEGSNSTWKDHDRNLGVHQDQAIVLSQFQAISYAVCFI